MEAAGWIIYKLPLWEALKGNSPNFGIAEFQALELKAGCLLVGGVKRCPPHK